MKGGISVNAAVINKNAKLQRVPEACADTNWSRNTLMKVAAEANAIIRVGRTVRIDHIGRDALFVRDSSKWRFRCCGTIPETTVYKGEVTRMSDLPIEPEIGDVYKVSGKTVFFDGCWNEIASAE